MEIKMTSFLSALAVAACTAVFAEPTVVDGALTFNVAEGAEENWSGSIPEGVSKIVKTGSGHATITSANAAFKGSVVIENGVLEITHKEALGTGNTIEVLSNENGSGQYRVTLHQSAANGNTGNVMGNEVKIRGAGPDGKGAIYLDGTGRIDEMLGNVTLTGDATIGQWAKGYRGIAGELDLAGYTLTLDGSKHFVVNGSCKVKNMAHIINNVAVLLEDATYENCENALWTKNKYMSVYDISKAVPWSLVHNGGDLCVPVDEDVYSGKAVGNVFHEDVTLNADLKLAKDYKAYIFLEFAGNVTGADHGISFSDSKTPARTVFSGSHSKIGALTIPNTNVTVEVTGRLDAKTVSVKSGTLKVINGGLLYASGANASTYTVGNADTGNSEKSAHLVVGKDSAIDFAPQASGQVTANIKLDDVGTKPAFLEVLEGATVSNNIQGAWSSPNSKSALHNYGTIYSTAYGGGNDGTFARQGSSFVGIYGGEFKFRTTLYLSTMPTSTGVIDQKGGLFRSTGGSAFGFNGCSDYRLSGGTLQYDSVLKMCDYSWNSSDPKRDSSGGSATLTLYGENCPTATLDSVDMCPRTNAFVSTINLNAGVFAAKYIASSGTDREYAPDATPPRSHLNFNGGTFAAQTNSSYFFYNTIPNAVTVFERGAIFDTSLVGEEKSVKMCSKQYDPNLKFRAPSGRGIKSIRLPADFDRSGFLGTMPVKITGGGGEGASAILEYDPKTKTAGDVIVTCQGWDYTEAPTVTVKANDFTTDIVCEVELTEDNRPMGPIIKTGAGELQFNCTNLAFNGTFVVSNGTLKILRYAHLPDDVCVKLAGGVFVYDWTDRTFREIGGHGEIYGSKNSAYHKCTVTDALCFDAKDALEGKFLAFTCGTLAMGDALKVKIDNAEALATATFESGSPRHFDLMTLADGKTFSRLPECEVRLPDRWRIRLSNGATALQLCRDRGMSIVVR